VRDFIPIPRPTFAERFCRTVLTAHLDELANMDRELLMTDAIQADLERAQQMHQMISDTLAGSYDGELRSTLFAGFMSVCLCHHEAILS
jgi:hypothetical protein